jgi:hypothetical protein
MPDAIQVFPVGFRVTDTAGATVSGAKIKFYNAGALVTRTVYSNSGLSSSLGSVVYCGSDGFPVASEGSATEVAVYTGTTAYKVIITTSADVEIITLDNLLGALDTSTYLTTGSTSTLSIPVISKTSNYTIVAAERGKLVQGNPSGGNFTLTLDAAATLGDGWNVEVRNSSVTTGQVILAASEAIAFEGQTFTSRALEIGEAMAIRCDGVAFKVVSRIPPLMSSRGPAVITITDRVTSDPGSPTPGARYIVQTGYGSYATGDIIEATGVTFNKYTPPANCGWIAYVLDEKVNYQFKVATWVRLGIVIQVFTTTGANTYTPTTGMAMCKVTSTGGGGGGGGADANDASSAASGGGGGAGGTCIETFTAADIGASQTVTIGAGGAGGAAATGATGTTGGSTTFGALHTATGGAGGVGVQTTAIAIGAGGAGGIPTDGILNVDGGDGGSGSVDTSVTVGIGGQGGASLWGGGGKPAVSSGDAAAAGTAARAYGSGGGGAVARNNFEAAGGAGKDGVCMVEEYF